MPAAAVEPVFKRVLRRNVSAGWCLALIVQWEVVLGLPVDRCACREAEYRVTILIDKSRQQ